MTATAEPQPQAAQGRKGFSLPPWWEKALFPLFIVFAYLVLILVFRPQGLLGEQTREAG